MLIILRSWCNVRYSHNDYPEVVKLIIRGRDNMKWFFKRGRVGEFTTYFECRKSLFYGLAGVRITAFAVTGLGAYNASDIRVYQGKKGLVGVDANDCKPISKERYDELVSQGKEAYDYT